jgi:sugar/nucleoside kinase (ribokinase family)
MSAPLKDVLGIGNAIVDVLTHAEDEFLERQGMAKGAMTLIDDGRALELYGQMTATHACPGGSAANTLAGLASLGGSAAYIGKVRDDALGHTFRQHMTATGVSFDTPPATTGPGTGRCLIFVTPDAQRTMQTFLGASATIGPEEVDPRVVRAASITYLEGYLFDPPAAKQAFFAAARHAHEAGRRVALTLSDPFCVGRHRDEFLHLIAEHVDILFANELELEALYREGDFERALGRLHGRCEVAAITRGPRGSVIVADGERIEVGAEPVAQVVDTTGAGDLYAAGFLYGLARGKSLELCGRLGSLAAAEVISHWGARPERSLRELVRSVHGSDGL